MRAVNLLPRETGGRQAGIDRVLVVAVGLTVVVLAAVAGAYFLEKSHASNERQQLAAMQAALAQAQSEQNTNTSPQARLQVPVVLSQEQPWHVALDAALAGRVAWDVLLRQLEYAVPDRVRLTNVNVGGTGSATGADGTITISGNAFTAKDVAVFLGTIARIPNITQVALVNSTGSTGSSVMNFQITAQMTLPAAPAAPGTDTTATTTTTTGG